MQTNEAYSRIDPFGWTKSVEASAFKMIEQQASADDKVCEQEMELESMKCNKKIEMEHVGSLPIDVDWGPILHLGHNKVSTSIDAELVEARAIQELEKVVENKRKILNSRHLLMIMCVSRKWR